MDLLQLGATAKLDEYLLAFEKAITLDDSVPQKEVRMRLICGKALQRAKTIRENDFNSYKDADVIMNTETGSFDKSVKQVENLVKLCMQKLVTSFKALQDDDLTDG